ncbi:MAG TPA: phage holin family protein [Spirochaetota bacterium]|nr:phage holin family protein [Spirochaetota bacterium]
MEREDKDTRDDIPKDEKSQFDFDFFTRLFKPVKTLFELQFRILKIEFKRESERFAEGISALVSGCFFLIMFWILLNVLTILAINEFIGLKLFFSVLIVCGVNLFFAIILFLRAKSKMKKEFFEDTRKIFEETIDDLKK